MKPFTIELEQIECQINALLAQQPAALYQPTQYMLSLGGKRIRPLLCVLSHRLFSKETQDIYTLAAAIEIFHNFTLVHDDIMDKANTRRGLATVHTKWNQNQAILSGDVMLIEAFQALSELKEKKQLRSVWSCFVKLSREVCIGQQLDMDFELRPEVSMNEYLEMIRLKTAVLVGGSLQLGAIYAGADEVSEKSIYAAGEALGLVFQMQDDYLDAFGDARFGKTLGGDIMASKKTYVYLKTLEKLEGQDREDFVALYTSAAENKVSLILDLMRALGIDKDVQEEIRWQYQQAIKPLKALGGNEAARRALVTLISQLFDRQV